MKKKLKIFSIYIILHIIRIEYIEKHIHYEETPEKKLMLIKIELMRSNLVKIKINKIIYSYLFLLINR